MVEISAKIRPSLIALNVGDEISFPIEKQKKCTNSGIRTGRHHESSIHHQDRSDKPHHQGETHIIEPNYQNYVFDTIYRPRSPLRCVSE